MHAAEPRRRPVFSHARAGTATVELAVCLPLVVLMVLAPIELCFRIQDRTTAEIAAYEGIRRAVLPGASSADAVAAARAVLETRGRAAGTVATSPAELADASLATPLTVTVTIPAGEPGSLRRMLLPPRPSVGRATMLKEY